MTRREMIKVLVIPENNGLSFNACGWIRLVDPFMEINSGNDVSVQFGGFKDIERWSPHVIVSQRCALSLDEIDRIDKLKRNGIKFIYDLDDDLINIPSTHSEALYFREKRSDIIQALRAADLITVSTLELSNSLLDSGLVSKDILKVVQNELNSSWVEDDTHQDFLRTNDHEMVYMGSPSHIKDWLLVENTIQHWLSSRDDFSLRVIGIPEKYIKLHDKISYIPTPVAAQASYPAFVNWYRSLPKFKIGIHPMEANALNRAKSNIKILQYASQGSISVSSENPDIIELSKTLNFGIMPRNNEEWRNALDLAASRSLDGQGSQSLSKAIKDEHVLSIEKGSAFLIRKEIENLLKW